MQPNTRAIPWERSRLAIAMREEEQPAEDTGRCRVCLEAIAELGVGRLAAALPRFVECGNPRAK